LITDFAGNPIGEFNPRRELGLRSVADVSAITFGPVGFAFAAVEATTSARLVTFLLR
jgi:hypothetical protein